MPNSWDRPIDRAFTARYCLASITQLVASCGDMHSVTANEFSVLLDLVGETLGSSLDDMLAEEQEAKTAETERARAAA